MLSFYRVEKFIEQLTGITPIKRDMCVNSCIAYTGPFATLQACPIPACQEPRYHLVKNKSVARRQFTTIPLAPQLQALRRSVKSSEQMNYRQKVSETFIEELRTNNNRKLTPYTDFFHGQAYLETFQFKDRDGNAILNPDDITLTLSIDGAQLYRNKFSDCTIYIWIVMDLPPEIHYRKDHVGIMCF